MSTPFVLLTLTHGLAVLLMPFVLTGVINRTKSWWAGRKGPRLTQSFHDLRRLLGKRPVVSSVASPVFRMGAWAVLVTGLVVMGMSPLLGQFAPLQFSHDFIAVAYTLGLGRLLLMLSAMDVGSPFEGMGAAREAMFGAFAEPALFLLIGTASAATGLSSFADLLGHLHHTPYYLLMVLPLTLALLILLQTEAARVPVDDPLTHLELTMIHEAMVLDHSGPLFSVILYAASIKLLVLGTVLLHVIAPFEFGNAWLDWPLYIVEILGLSAIIGILESVMARLQMRHVPYLLTGALLFCGFGFILLIR